MVWSAPPDAKQLARQLREGDRQAKRDAAYALSQLGPGAKPALPALIEGARSRDAQIRAFSVSAIARIGPGAQEAIPVLIDQMRRWSAQQQYRAAMALARIGKPAIGPLIETLTDKNAGKRAGAALALGAIGPHAARAAGPLAGRLEDSVEAVRRRAATALAQMGPAAIEPVSRRIGHRRAEVRAAALDVFRLMGKPARPAIGSIRNALKDDDVGVRAAALRALAAVNGIDKSTAPLYVKALTHSETVLRDAAFESLAASSSIDAALPGIVAHLDDDDRTVRRRCVELIALHRSARPKTVSKLVALARRDEQLRPAIERCLVALGPAAAPAMREALPGAGEAAELLARALSEVGDSARSALLESLHSKDDAARAAALRSLAALESSPETIKAVRAAFADHSPVVRAAAADAALRLSAKDDSLRAKLIEALGDRAADVRRAAVPVLASASPNDASLVVSTAELLEGGDAGTCQAVLAAMAHWKWIPDRLAKDVLAAADADAVEQRLAAIPLLEKLPVKYRRSVETLVRERLRDQRPAVRVAAIRAVDGTIADAEKRVALLQAALGDRSTNVRSAACWALGKEGRGARRAVPKLLELLGRKEDEGAARQALQSIGAAGPEAVPILRKMLKDRDPRKRGYAVFLLGRVEPPPKEILPELEKLKDQGPERFRRLVRSTIRRIGG